MHLFLSRSGYALRAESETELNNELEKLILDVVENRTNFDDLVVWFKNRIEPL